MNTSLHTEIIEHLSIPILMGEPIFNDKGEVFDIKCIFANKAFEKCFNLKYKNDLLLSEYANELTKDINWSDRVSKTIKTGESYELVIFTQMISTWFLVKIDKIFDNKIIVSFTNINEYKESEQQLKHNAYHDTLTGIFNRAKLTEDIAELLKNNQANKEKFGIILLNIDNMKFVNDSQGHAAGDEVIKKSVKILKNFEKSGIFTYRFDGDEFVLLAKNITTKDSLINTADAILEFFNMASIQFSAGISVYPDDGEDASDLLRYADMAMNDAKKSGKNNIVLYKTVMYEKFMERLNLQTHLNDAIKNKIFDMYFQPQFNVVTGELRGFEALLRWHDEELGWINPEQFIPLAEETKLILPIGEWILETAIKTLARWQQKYNFKGIMSVNVSPIQLKNSDFIFILKKFIKEFEIDPKCLEIEVTEGILIENKEQTIQLLKEIRDMGIGVSLDDFGTGYSSLSYLQMLPITTLKIDKSFIANITSDEGVEANITDSIVSMVTKMGLETIAEGVEHNDQLELLKKIKCQNIQGFLRGKPMPADRCESVLAGDKNALLTIFND